ncbi:MAG: phenylacetic acid degradation protein, partial [Acidimicrobiia bacterium]|nr:phenylacetic acid degradation protein [Acidimicrobiia bacterium]
MNQLPVTLEEIQAFNAEIVPFCAEMNIHLESIEDGMAWSRFTYEERWTRPVDFVAGPILMAMADATFYWALFTKIG